MSLIYRQKKISDQKELERNIQGDEKQGATTRLLYTARLSFKTEGEIKSFSEKKKVFFYHQASTTGTNVKGYFLKRKKIKR